MRSRAASCQNEAYDLSLPVDDIRNTRKLVSIWDDGREIQPLVASAATH